MSDTRVIITEQNAIAFVEAWATYGAITDVADPVVLKLRIVGMRKPVDGHWPIGKPYIAHLEPCLRDESREGQITPCENPPNHLDAYNSAARKRVRRFMREVLATYGAKLKTVTRTVGVPLSHYRKIDYAREMTA